MTNTSNRGGYRQTRLGGLPSDETTTKPQEIKRGNLQTLHQQPQDQRVSTDTTAEQNTSIKVIYCKAA
jgi:hypothetical protein